MAATAPASRDSVWVRFLKGFNAATELPGLYELSWVLFWFYNLLLGPAWALGLLTWTTLEGISGKWWRGYNKPQPGQAILITGCDTGFGHEAALRLARQGWTVYAGCLTDAGMQALAAAAPASKLVPVQMDVTKPADVQRVVKRLEADKVSLYAVVNNAGVGRGNPMDWSSMDEYRQIMEVNYFSVISVIKGCLPLLKESRGRIINISSIAGLAAAPLMSAYSASKHAVEAFSTAVRIELKPWGIKLVTINPSFHKTPIATNALPHLQRSFNGLPAAVREAYGDEYFQACADLTNTFTQGCWDPVHVVDKIVKATTLVDPMPNYLVGCDGRFQLVPLVCNTPANFQFWLVSNTYYKTLVPAAIRKAFKPKGTPLPTNTSGSNGNGNGGSR